MVDTSHSTSSQKHRGSLLARGSVYTAATAAQMFSSLIVLPFLSRTLSPADLGRVTLAVVLMNLLGLVATLGFPAVISREYFAEHGPVRARLLSAFTICAAGVVIAVCIATGPVWAAALGGFSTPLLLGCVAGFGWGVIVTTQAVLRAEGRARHFVVLAGINVLGGQLGGVLATILLNPTATTYLSGVAAGSLTAGALGVVWVRPTLRGWRRYNQMRSWARTALPTLPHSAALFLMVTGDRFVVEIQLGSAAVAGYAMAYQAGAVGISLIAAANNAWAPMIYAAREEQRWSVLVRSTTQMLRAAAVLASSIALAAPLGLWILADSSKYSISDLTPVVAITALAALPYVLYLASVHILFQQRHTMALLWITPTSVVMGLAAKAAVLPTWGVSGAAVMTVAAYTLLAVGVSGAGRRVMRVAFTHRTLPILLATAVCVTAALLPTTLIGNSVRVVLFCVTAGVGAFVLRELARQRG